MDRSFVLFASIAVLIHWSCSLSSGVRLYQIVSRGVIPFHSSQEFESPSSLHENDHRVEVIAPASNAFDTRTAPYRRESAVHQSEESSQNKNVYGDTHNKVDESFQLSVDQNDPKDQIQVTVTDKANPLAR